MHYRQSEKARLIRSFNCDAKPTSTDWRLYRVPGLPRANDERNRSRVRRRQSETAVAGLHCCCGLSVLSVNCASPHLIVVVGDSLGFRWGEKTSFSNCPQRAEHPEVSRKPSHAESDPLNAGSALSVHAQLPGPTGLRVYSHVSWVFQNVLCTKFPLQARFDGGDLRAPIATQGSHQFADQSLSRG